MSQSNPAIVQQHIQVNDTGRPRCIFCTVQFCPLNKLPLVNQFNLVCLYVQFIIQYTGLIT